VFTEIDGMILGHIPLNARANLELYRAQGRFRSNWEYERGANHVHSDMSLPAREHVRREKAMVASLSEALRQAYLQKAFVIVHWFAYAVSFYQAVEGAPREGIRFDKEAAARGLCVTCQAARNWLVSQQPDSEFREAEWGTCESCGEDVLVRAPEVLTLIGPTV
jgi:hypothetical protein